MRSFSSRIFRPSHMVVVALIYFSLFENVRGETSSAEKIYLNVTGSQNGTKNSEATLAELRHAGDHSDDTIEPTNGTVTTVVPPTNDPVYSTATNDPVDSIATNDPVDSTATNNNARVPLKTPTTDSNQTETKGCNSKTIAVHQTSKDPQVINNTKNETCLLRIKNNTTYETLLFDEVVPSSPNATKKFQQINLTNPTLAFPSTFVIWKERVGDISVTVSMVVTSTPTIAPDFKPTDASFNDTTTTTRRTGKDADKASVSKATAAPLKIKKYTKNAPKIFLFIFLSFIVLTACYVSYIKCSGSGNGWEAFKTQCALTRSNVRGWYVNRSGSRLLRRLSRTRTPTGESNNNLLQNNYELL